MSEPTPLPPDFIPPEFKSAWQDQKIEKIIHISRVDAVGRPEYEMPDCPECGSHFVYSLGPFNHLSNRELLLVDEIMAYRCANEVCPIFNQAMIFLPEVHEALRQEIKATPPSLYPQTYQI